MLFEVTLAPDNGELESSYELGVEVLDDEITVTGYRSISVGAYFGRKDFFVESGSYGFLIPTDDTCKENFLRKAKLDDGLVGELVNWLKDNSDHPKIWKITRYDLMGGITI